MKNITTEFNDLIGELTNSEFDNYVNSWRNDEQEILDIMNNWEDETKEDAIMELKAIIKARKKETKINNCDIEDFTNDGLKEELRKVIMEMEVRKLNYKQAIKEIMGL